MIESDFILQDGIMTKVACQVASPQQDFQALLTWQSANQAALEALLAEHGALLFRGFGVDSEQHFADYIAALPEQALNYVDGNSPRTQLSDKVYTSTEYPPEYDISLHNELSYSPKWPANLYFCCVTAPLKDGFTLLSDGRKVLAQLDPQVSAKFEQLGVLYTRYLHGKVGVGPSWQQTFETQERDEVEAFCAAGGIRFNWVKDGLQLSQNGPGVIAHPKDGQRAWFNQADQFHPSNLPAKAATAIKMLSKGDPLMYPTNAFYGDGSEISVETLDHIRAVFANNLIRFPWHQGDLLWVDNALMAHGRSSFVGERKILVAMS